MPPVLGSLDDPGRLLGPPMGDRLPVALLGLLLRLLAAPVQPPPDDLADVLGVVLDAEVAADQFGDPAGAPEVVVPAVGLGPLQQQGLKLSQLLGGESRGRGPGWGLAASTRGDACALASRRYNEVRRTAEDAGEVTVGDSPRCISSTARRRRRSSSSAVPMGLIPVLRPRPPKCFFAQAGVSRPRQSGGRLHMAYGELRDIEGGRPAVRAVRAGVLGGRLTWLVSEPRPRRGIISRSQPSRPTRALFMHP